MIEPVVLAAFVAAVALLVITPGPDMLFIVAVGARSGPRAGMLAATGVAAGLAVHAAATAFGLAALFQAMPVTYDIVRILGAVYLLYLGIVTLRRRREGFTEQTSPRPVRQTGRWPARHAFTRGLVTNLLNPKVVLFNAAFLPQFVDPSGASTTLQLLVLGACFVLVDLLIDGPIGLLAGRLGTWLKHRQQLQRRLNMATGSVFIGLSARLAFDQR